MFHAKVMEKIQAHILCSITVFFLIGTVRERKWKIQVKDDNIIRYMHIACWIIKATNTNSEYVILYAFPWLQWFHESPSMLSTRMSC